MIRVEAKTFIVDIYLIETDRFVIIDHKFPVIGHSFLPSDYDLELLSRRHLTSM